MVGFLYERTHTRADRRHEPLAKPLPIAAGFLLFFALGSLGLPGLSGFVGEFLSLLGLFQYSHWMAAVAALGVILAACYLLWMYQRTMFNDRGDDDVKPVLRAHGPQRPRDRLAAAAASSSSSGWASIRTPSSNFLHVPVQRDRRPGHAVAARQAHGGALWRSSSTSPGGCSRCATTRLRHPARAWSSPSRPSLVLARRPVRSSAQGRCWPGSPRPACSWRRGRGHRPVDQLDRGLRRLARVLRRPSSSAARAPCRLRRDGAARPVRRCSHRAVLRPSACSPSCSPTATSPSAQAARGEFYGLLLLDRHRHDRHGDLAPTSSPSSCRSSSCRCSNT